jgi:hypothetical protein
VAQLRSDSRRLARYLRGDKKTRREVAAIDSLSFRAFMQDPFV